MGRPSDAGERPPLSRERIVAAAIAFVDRRGLTALTMRRLGTELGVEAMSLYRYVAGRDDLLEGMVDQMVDAAPPGPERRAARSGRRLAGLPAVARPRRPAAGQEHPHVFPLIATRHPAAPWLRPPLRSLRVVEDFLSTLVARGFTDDGAVAAYRAFSSFLLGHLLLEAAMLGSRTAPAVDLEDDGALGSRPRAARSTCGSSRSCAGWRTACPRTTRPRSSSGRWRTCWTGSSATCPTT